MNYHDRPEYSASMLKKYCCGTAVDFWAAYQDPDRMPMVPSDAMKQGSLVDCLITEPEKFSRKYIVAPIVDRRTKVGKAQWAETQEIARTQGAEVITTEWHHTAQLIVSKLKNDPIASEFLQGSGQVPHFWHDAENDVECRYLPDLEQPEDGLLVDLKKARSANPHDFARQSFALGYDIQVAHYAEGFRDRHGAYPKQIVLLAYEWAYPFNYSVNVISDELLEVGRQRRNDAIAGIKACRGTNEWPSWGINTMEAPRWFQVDDPANDTDVADLLEGV